MTNKTGKRALITGITGQDGSYLTELLLEKKYKVYGLVRRTSTESDERIRHLLDKIELIDGDLIDQNSIINAIKQSDADEVYNLAAQSFVKTSWSQPILTGEVTGIGVTRMLEAIRAVNDRIKFYQASSSEMFGKVHETPQKETTVFHPRSPYGVAKVYGYYITQNYRESYGIFGCNGILFNHECISENTPIITRDKKTKIISIKRIKDLSKARAKGKNVQQWHPSGIEIWDGDDFVSLNLITASKRKNNDNFACKTINSRNGIIEVTNHHNMLDIKNKKIKAKNIVNGSKLLHKKFPMQKSISCLSKEEAIFIGMMVGDGHINKEGRSFFSNNNKEIIETIKNLWTKIGLGTTSVRTFKTEYGKSTQIRLNGNCDYLRNLFSQIYTSDGFKKVPDRILNSNMETKLAFLEGYNCCDGLKSNPCRYLFKNFKTNSIVLAQGLLFLIANTTKQEFNINFEEDKRYYGYYSINFLSPKETTDKETKVKELLKLRVGQREICKLTGISRNFIRKIQRGGHIEIKHRLSKSKDEVKKTLYHKKQPLWVYDLETESGRFMAGEGTIVVSNSPRRGIEFVTRKISHAVARIHLGMQKDLTLGNLDAKRDWGFAGDYVRAMWLMMQEEKPDDYVIATGETHSIREFLDIAFAHIGVKDWSKHVKQDARFMRPAEVNLLRGDASKARKKLGWKPKTSFKQLVEMMVDSDIETNDRLRK